MLHAVGAFSLQALAAVPPPAHETCHDKLFDLKLQRYRNRRQRRHRPRGGGGSRREQTVRAILRGLCPGERWESVRPAWLVNPFTNRRMEIDCYSQTLRIAVEVQGEHHYNSKYIGIEEYQKQRKRDHLKSQIIKGRGIQLICVPSPDSVADADIEAWLCMRLSRLL